MNFLAHARLSFHHPDILVGNMISDFVKGNKKYDYPSGIQKGIYLHRCIDTYTDDHPATREAKELFRPAYRLYAGAMMDVVYDHFLASDEQEFTASSLLEFSQEVYSVLHTNMSWLPPPFARMFPYMRSQNWLYHYRSLQGARNSFEGLVRRAAFINDSRPAAKVLEQNYQLLQQFYRQFWADVKPYVRDEFQRLENLETWPGAGH